MRSVEDTTSCDVLYSPAQQRSNDFKQSLEFFKNASPQELFEVVGIPPDGYIVVDGKTVKVDIA